MGVDNALEALGLPPYRELEPEELRYLRAVCRWLQDHPPPDDARFDADELGIDPEDDYEDDD